MKVGEYYKDLDADNDGFRIIKLTEQGAMVLWDSESHPREIYKESFDRWLENEELGIKLIPNFNDYYDKLNN